MNEVGDVQRSQKSFTPSALINLGYVSTQLLYELALAKAVHMYTYDYGQCFQPGPTGG
jgi:hypothetical protein